jgi:hypothetical protein
MKKLIYILILIIAVSVYATDRDIYPPGDRVIYKPNTQNLPTPTEGTSDGSLLYWDETTTAWLISDVTKLKWDDGTDTLLADTLTDGTTSINSGNYTGVGNITGSDVDISAGTGTITAATFTDSTTTITGGNYTGVGNITGSDIDISAGTGDYTSTGDLTAGGNSALGDEVGDSHNIMGSLNVGGPIDHLVINSDGDTHWDGDGGLLVGSMFIPGVDIEVSTGDANPHEISHIATGDGWQASALNEITFPTGGDEHYLTVSEIGLYKCDHSISAHTAGGGATAIHSGIMVDNVAQRNDGEGHTHVSNFNDDQHLGSPALVNCPNGDEQISLWISADNSQDVHIEHGTLMVMMIAGPTVLAPENVIFNAEDVIFALEQVVFP